MKILKAVLLTTIIATQLIGADFEKECLEQPKPHASAQVIQDTWEAFNEYMLAMYGPSSAGNTNYTTTMICQKLQQIEVVHLADTSVRNKNLLKQKILDEQLSFWFEKASSVLNVNPYTISYLQAYQPVYAFLRHRSICRSIPETNVSCLDYLKSWFS